MRQDGVSVFPCVARQSSETLCQTMVSGRLWRGGGPCVGFQQLLRALGALLPRCWSAPEAAAGEQDAPGHTSGACAWCGAIACLASGFTDTLARPCAAL